MFHKAPPVVGPILDGVFGLPGIAILALLAGIGTGLAVARIDLPKPLPTHAATPAAGRSEPGHNVRRHEAELLEMRQPCGLIGKAGLWLGR